MKLLIGIVIGAAAGGYIVNNMSADQRRKLESQIDRMGDKVSNAKVTEAVKDNVQKVASDVADVAASKIDEVGDKASEAVGTTTA
ncbi:MAG: hypothetical protein ABJH68_11470 [Ilumatobacter sp.]|uniref:hypothetical protein n=1 Tax=Ilumatobacter sp. TaxID=1967498 RepID=UPI0032977877